MSSELFKIIAVVILAVILITALRKNSGEYSVLLLIAVIIVGVTFFAENLSDLFFELRNLFAVKNNIVIYFEIVLKALGIAYITSFAADVCRDYGYSSLAQLAELGGKISILILSLPLVKSLLNTVSKFIEL